VTHHVQPHRHHCPPRRKLKTAPAVPAIVTTAKRRTHKEKPLPDLPDDPEADARVKAFFARMVRPR
jgi:hypothetical protein